MVDGEIFNDGGRLDHRLIAIDQHRKLARRMCRADEVHIGHPVIGPRIDVTEFEFGPVRVERDQRLPGVGREAMAIEGQHYQVPASIAARRAISRSLVAGGGASSG